jgi:predicted enzyme related to lactoylglutathione lyase
MTAATAVTAPPRGRFVWHDLATTDIPGAVSFYTSLVGWGTAPFQGGAAPYTMWSAGDTMLGGLMPLPADAAKSGATPHWLAYVAVPNVDDTAKLASGLGATVMVPPTDIPTVGRFTMLRDPQGASFAAFTALNVWPGHDGQPLVREFSWHELGTADGSAAFAFYQALFGWVKTDSMDMGPDGIYQMFGREGVTLGGVYSVKGDAARHPAWLHYIRVPDVDRAAQAIPGLGGRVVRPPMDVPGGSRILQGIDPQGATFALHSTAG